MLEIFQLLGLIDTLRGKKGAIKHYEKKLHEYKEQEAYILVDIGVLYFDDEEFETALEYFKEALEAYRKLDDKDGEAYVLDLMGDTCLIMRDVNNALKYYQDAFKLYSSLRSPLKKDMFEKLKEVKRAKKALEIAADKEKM
ncbi:MAG: tetratricopeptide repeat protein [Euryarchaeota archaeon]|nr:tetratricopeptide repeat protein [Euryarchaeota archaeon]